MSRHPGLKGPACADLYLCPYRRRGLLLCPSGRSLLKTVGSAEFFAKSFDPARGIDEFLLAGEKLMTRRTNVHRNLRQRAPRDKRVAASAVHIAGLIFWMNFSFH